jgi:hypothetical protein
MECACRNNRSAVCKARLSQQVALAIRADPRRSRSPVGFPANRRKYQHPYSSVWQSQRRGCGPLASNRNPASSHPSRFAAVRHRSRRVGSARMAQEATGCRPTRHGWPVGRFSHLEVIHASNVLDDAGAGLVPDVHAEGEVRLGLHGQARLDSPWPAGIYTRMLLRSVPRPNGFIEPCLPSPAPKPPAGAGWIHEIKLEGFRLLARRDAAGVRLLTRRRGIQWPCHLVEVSRA